MRIGPISRFHLVTALALLLGFAVPGWWAAGGVLAGYLAVVALGVTYPHLQFFLPVRCRGRASNKAVALTFDDGPDPETTPALLDLLRKHQVRAAFFCIGSKAAQQPDLVRRIAADGHLLANHGYSHSCATNFFRIGRLRSDLGQCQEALAQATGQAPRYFRPPVGLTNPRVARVVRELGLETVGWSAGGNDQSAKTPAAILARVRRGLGPGAIILLHDGGGTGEVLLAAVDQLLGQLRREGYQVWRLDELLA